MKFMKIDDDDLPTLGSFNNYVDRMLPFFDPFPPPAWTVFIPSVWAKTDIFDPSPLFFVHVVIEWHKAKSGYY